MICQARLNFMLARCWLDAGSMLARCDFCWLDAGSMLARCRLDVPSCPFSHISCFAYPASQRYKFIHFDSIRLGWTHVLLLNHYLTCFNHDFKQKVDLSYGFFRYSYVFKQKHTDTCIVFEICNYCADFVILMWYQMIVMVSNIFNFKKGRGEGVVSAGPCGGHSDFLLELGCGA